jgi:hypothetical protein
VQRHRNSHCTYRGRQNLVMLTLGTLRWLGFGWPVTYNPRTLAITLVATQREGTNSTAEDGYGTGEGPLWWRTGVPPTGTNRGTYGVGGLGATQVFVV